MWRRVSRCECQLQLWAVPPSETREPESFQGEELQWHVRAVVQVHRQRLPEAESLSGNGVHESIQREPSTPPAAAPEVFEFVGIWRDWEIEKAEQQERMTNARRSPSPRESWFEMNHPMGS
jgi:hypothetical protein